GPLLDRDRRGEAIDRVDVRLVHLPEELAGVRREALDVPPLALGVERIERERRLSRAAHPGDDDELAARQVDRDVLQVVLTRVADPDGVGWVAHYTGLGRQERTDRLDQAVEDVGLHPGA